MIVVQKSKTLLYWDLFFSLWGKMLSIQDLTINKPPLIRKPRSYLTPNMYVQCAWSKCSLASELLLLMDILGTMLIHLPRQVHPNLTSRHVTFDAAVHWKYPDCRMFRAKDRHTIDFFFFSLFWEQQGEKRDKEIQLGERWETFKEGEANDAAHASGSPRPLSSPGLWSEGRISSVLSPLSSFFRLHRARPPFFFFPPLFPASARQRS